MHKYYIFEGADGIGKTTLAKAFAESIKAQFTYEPFGHTDETAQLRKWALTKEVPQLAREYLLLAGRDLGYNDLRNWLEYGPVVTDRSLISGAVYAQSEGFPFQEWWDMAKGLTREAFWENAVIIFCSNKAYNNKDNPEDRYDGRDKDFHESISKSFSRVIERVRCELSVVEVIPRIDFEISFDRSRAENLARLKRLLDEDGFIRHAVEIGSSTNDS